jgi:anti-sigma B factor antagonist
MAANPAPIPQLKLETVRTPEETLVRCTGRITSTTSDTLQTTIRGLIPEAKRVVLDLADVNYIDSSGLGALVGLYVSATKQHCQLKLIHLNHRVKELFRITKLASVFEGHEELSG